MRLFNKKKKKSRFISEGQSPEVNTLGIKNEYNNNLLTKIILLVFALLGFILCVLDIRDDGMLLKLSEKVKNLFLFYLNLMIAGYYKPFVSLLALLISLRIFL